jgi:hypothetical protein
MRLDHWQPETKRRLDRLTEPHFRVLGLIDDCQACTIDGWARRALAAARQGASHRPTRWSFRHRPVAARRVLA